jgi:hypothetical protein
LKTQGTFRSDAARGALLALYPAVLTLLASYAGRRALALREGLFGRIPWQFTAGGLCADLAVLMPALAVAIGLYWLLAAAARTLLCRRGGGVRAGGAGPLAVWAVGSAGMWLVSVAASEFKFQRGLYPTLREAAINLPDRGTVLGVLPVLLAERYRIPSLVCVFLALLMLARLGWGPPARQVLSRPFALGFAGAVALVAAAGGAVWASSPRLFSSGTDRAAFYPPIMTLLSGFGPHPAIEGMRGILEAREPDRAGVVAGSHALGFGSEHAEALRAYEEAKTKPCGAHPLARGLPGAPTPAERDRGVAATPLVEDFTALSRALFAAPRGPLQVIQVALESFRADDVSALNPAALPEVTPFTNSVYAASRAGGPGVIAFPHAYQGGIRTAQAISALMCGIGAAPYGIALVRDLDYLPLRCLPDVLVDAGFAPHVVFGSALSFDNLLEFFRYHGVSTTQKADFPGDAPKGAWKSVTDRAVYDAALDLLQASAGHRYTFILTMTSHLPFDPPEDMPPEVKARIDRALRAAGVAVDRDDQRRLSTLAYADWALERLVRRIEASPEAARSVIVVSADHSTSDPFVWRSAPDVRALSGIPLFVYLPRPFLMGSADPRAVLSHLEQVRERAAEAVVSADDVPTLLLALLSASAPLASLPPAWRWHTLGGMVTSPDYVLPGRPVSALWGIDAASRLFSVDRDRRLPIALPEPNPSMPGAGGERDLGEVGGAVAAFLSSFLRGYARRCPGAEHVRFARLLPR